MRPAGGVQEPGHTILRKIGQGRAEDLSSTDGGFKIIPPAEKTTADVLLCSTGRPHYLLSEQLIERYGKEITEQGGLDVMAAMDLNLQNWLNRPCAINIFPPSCRGHW
jgi:hypothetical protein